MAKGKSRIGRWNAAVQQADSQRSALLEIAGDLAAALERLNEVRSEYEDWQSNLPENLQNSALAEKLEAVCALELEFPDGESVLEDWDTVSSAIDEALCVDLPLGFGRD